jgi:putative acetyltransferase
MSGPATIELRQEEPEDAAAIREIHRVAFGGEAEAGIVDAVRTAGAAVLSMVAVNGGGADTPAPTAGDTAAGPVIAHVLFTRVTVTVEGGEDVSLVGLAPVAVLPSQQGRGVGTMLIEAGLERLRAESHPAVVVVGDPGYYLRFGFLPGSRWGLRWEVDAPEEAFMVAELSPGALAGIRGVVRFRPEFAGV